MRSLGSCGIRVLASASLVFFSHFFLNLLYVAHGAGWTNQALPRRSDVHVSFEKVSMQVCSSVGG